MLYGNFPFHSNDVSELENLIIKGRYELVDDISKDARNLISRMLTPVSLRATIPEIYSHPWMKDVDPSCIISA